MGNRSEGVSKHAVSGSLTWRVPSFRATLRSRYFSDQFQDITNEVRLPPHAVFDFSAAVTVRRGVELTGSVENLLDREYIASNYGPTELGAPRTLSLGVRLAATAGSRQDGSVLRIHERDQAGIRLTPDAARCAPRARPSCARAGLAGGCIRANDPLQGGTRARGRPLHDTASP